ncbi:MAG: inorganic phosphate transporter [Magnetococcales bacterium]|nr:inorganic phosphate transporter [Magnetococcales bacterium]MBF0115207.1 inorganic phosphate transporter [Magnetococcales bacterium]
MDSNTIYLLMWGTIIIVLIFDFTNGFHDASNITGTIIASRAMTPIQASILTGVFHFIGPMLGGVAVANTIGGFVKIDDLPKIMSLSIVLSGICGSIFWNLLTWWFGLPSSSSHALVGGVAGAVLFAAGADHVNWGIQAFVEKGKMSGVTKVLLSLFISPVLGFIFAYILQKIVRRLTNAAKPSIDRFFKGSQYISAAALSFSHGTNDAQKSMGIIALALFLGGSIEKFFVPSWVILVCAGIITMGNMMGGWRIARTVGFGIYRVRPIHSFNSQLTSSVVIFGAALVGAPVSTTHVASSSIMGVGSADRPKAVKWRKGKEIFATWLLTIPGSGLVGGLTYLAANLLFNVGAR